LRETSKYIGEEIVEFQKAFQQFSHIPWTGSRRENHRFILFFAANLILPIALEKI
jgi:hypothetical protein